jgi:hypothetical protein
MAADLCFRCFFAGNYREAVQGGAQAPSRSDAVGALDLGGAAP